MPRQRPPRPTRGNSRAVPRRGIGDCGAQVTRRFAEAAPRTKPTGQSANRCREAQETIAERREIERGQEGVDEPDRILRRHILVEYLREEHLLLAVDSFDIRHRHTSRHKAPWTRVFYERL